MVCKRALQIAPARFQNGLLVFDKPDTAALRDWQDMDTSIDVVPTRAFLEIAEKRQVVPDAESYWQRVTSAAPTVNPANTVIMQRRMKL